MGTLKNKAAIVGIGETKYSKDSGVSELALQLEGAMRAIEDAGLRPEDIDGLIPLLLISVEDVATNLGIKDLKYAVGVPFGGASNVAALISAAMAVDSGIANYVLVLNGRNGASGRGVNLASLGVPGTFRYMQEFESIYGSVSPSQWYAPMAKRHMYEYGTTSKQLGAIAVAMRKHACLNDKAIMRTPLTLEEHQKSRMIADPLRLFDCCLRSDGAAAVIVTSAERAKNMKHPPVYIMGAAQGHPESPMSITQRPDMTVFGVKKAAGRAFAMAGVTPKDIDAAELYDCFTFTVLCQLEDIGFCQKGEGGPFVEGGRIELGGDLPVNTHGGLLSQAHAQGMNHIVEAVKQLRGQAGKSQVKDAEIVLVSGYGDFGDGSIAILRR